MGLDKVGVNNNVKILEIEGGWGIRQRLTQMGIHIGDKVVIKQNGMFGGPILIGVNNSEIALGRGMASRVKVEVLK